MQSVKISFWVHTLEINMKKKNNKRNKNWNLLCKVYLFDTKYLLHRLVADIDVLNLNRPANEIKFFVVKPFPVAMFPMDQGCKMKTKKKKIVKNYGYKHKFIRAKKKLNWI